MIMDRARPATLGRTPRLGLRVAGAGLLAATGGIHLDLYLTGYRSIPTIGWLFLLQVIAAFGLAAVVLVSGHRLAAAAGAGFALSTLGGYLLSVWIGLFGFKEVRTTAGIVAGVIEVAAFAVLAVLAAVPAPGQPPVRPRSPARWPPAAGERAGCRAGGGGRCPWSPWSCWASRWPGQAGRHQRAPAAAPTVRTAQAGGVTVLANARGLTLYWFAPDTADQVGLQRVLRRVLAAGEGTGDGRPGRHRHARHHQARGRLDAGHLRRAPAVHLRRRQRPGPGARQRVNLNGGLWHEVTPSG